MNNTINLLSIKIQDQYATHWSNLLALDGKAERSLDIAGKKVLVTLSAGDGSFVVDFSYAADKGHEPGLLELVRLASQSYYVVFRNFFIDNCVYNLFELFVVSEITFPLLKVQSKETLPYVEQFLSRVGYDFSITDNEQLEGFKVVHLQKRSRIKYFVTDLYTFLLFAAMRITPHEIRHEMILRELSLLDSERVIELGCGDGAFIFSALDDLSAEGGITKISGVEIDQEPYSKALERWKGAEAAEMVEIMQADITTCDQRFKAYDTVLLIEVIEHLEEAQLEALEKVVFDFIRPRHVLVSTPNADYNMYCPDMLPNGFRHLDHKFEWGKDAFVSWSQDIEGRYGYSTDYLMIGRVMQNNSSMTQMMVFRRAN